ncbi:hypothetical protein ASF72_02925 [Arthrobacter sp. Leaf141]|jgi:hypothetical protein|uniref:hypothetical protein n=1 Tax=Micrococcaceae TaxID=1268 RepID=UPI0006F90C4E|nr:MULTISPECIES: hypothetical protein [Micrococcaceae]KQQ92166.1 hypothetical protein ASF72_02925 [Arthrobacter sp. Leaf141]
MDEADQQVLTGGVITEHGLDPTHLWLEYIALGGDAPEQDLRSYLAGNLKLPAKDRDALAQAINEHCAANSLLGRVPLSDFPLAGRPTDFQDPYSSK